jgi:hypothetical protein
MIELAVNALCRSPSATPMTYTPAVKCLKRFAIPSLIVNPSFYPKRVSSYRHLWTATDVARFERVGVPVNNAGVAPTGRIDEALLDDWRAIMSTDLDGVFCCSRAAIRYLIAWADASRGVVGSWN